MRKLLFIPIMLFSFSILYATDVANIVQNEVEALKKQLPIEDANIKLYDVSYKAGKGLTYFYILKNATDTTRETIKNNLKMIEDKAFSELCTSLPEGFMNELTATKTNIVYKYSDNSSKLIAETSFDLNKCPKK